MSFGPPVIGSIDVAAAAVARQLGDLLKDRLLHRQHARVFLRFARRDADPQGLQCRDTGETGIDLTERDERSRHQADADQQHHRQRDLDHHEQAARALTLAALTQRATFTAQRGVNIKM
jgi:hypothetical protein